MTLVPFFLNLGIYSTNEVIKFKISDVLKSFSCSHLNILNVLKNFFFSFSKRNAYILVHLKILQHCKLCIFNRLNGDFENLYAKFQLAR